MILPVRYNEVNIWSWQNTVIVNTPDGFIGELNIYDILGKHVVSAFLQEGRNELEIAGPDGFYIVKLETEEGIMSKKVLLQ